MKINLPPISRSGFSLVELLVVITIIAGLAALAVPAYRKHVIKANITEAIGQLQGYKVLVEEYLARNGTWPPDGWNKIHLTTPPDKYQAISYGNNAPGGNRPFIAGNLLNDSGLFGSEASGYLALVGNLVGTGSSIQWNCRTSPSSDANSIDFKYLPKSCQCNGTWDTVCTY